MRADPMSFRPSTDTARQLDELAEHYYREMPPNMSQILTTAIDRLHAAVCRPAVTADPKPTRNRKPKGLR
jgi:hypothetical protein